MNNNLLKLIGVAILLIAVAYVAIPYDSDKAWWGYTDDFFVFMSGYAFFMATRTKSLKSRYLLYTISGSFFIIGMLALIALLILD